MRPTLLALALLALAAPLAAQDWTLVQAGRLYRAVGAVEWQRKAHAMAQRVR